MSAQIYQSIHDLLSLGMFVALLVLGIGMALNALLMVPPSETICIYAGILAASRPNSFGLSAIILLSLGNLLGTCPWFLLGRYRRERGLLFIPPMVLRPVPRRLLDLYTGQLPDFLQRFSTQESSLAFWIRFVPIVRSIVSYPAGYAGMQLPRFALYSYLGILGWVTIWITIGFVGGEIAYKLSLWIGAAILFAVTALYFCVSIFRRIS
jgi:alkaline phosphatase